MSGQTNRILKVFIQTKVDGEEVPENYDIIYCLKRAWEDKKMYRLQKNIHFCAYKIKYKNEESILMLFSMEELPGPLSGSSKSSDIIMDLVQTIENVLIPIDKFHLSRNYDGLKSNVGVLAVIKKYREEDIL